jgi:FAD/FMN-containing dehydrogenase
MGAHGAGHSYADAALNTHGAVIDLTGMRRILAWDVERGIIQIEPGATLRDVIRISLPDGWWLPVAPSTADATIGGCVALNVTGRNAWNYGSFGEHVRSLDVLLTTGEVLNLSAERSPQLFRAVVGSAGLLGIIISVTLQLRRVVSGDVDVRQRAAGSLAEVFALFEAERSADYLEALVDGAAAGARLGRAVVSATMHSDVPHPASLRLPASRLPDRLTIAVSRSLGTLCRPAAGSVKHLADRVMYLWTEYWNERQVGHVGPAGRTRRTSVYSTTFFPLEAFALYQAVLPHGMLSLQVFVPRAQAERVFANILERSQADCFLPLWSVIHRHRPDPFLLSYQVDGFSLETYYALTRERAPALRSMVRELMEQVITAGGRFYLAKDALLTSSLYRQSLGDIPVDTFLALKHRYDREGLLQSDLYRRVFQPPRDGA